MKYIALLVISLTFFFSCQENKENTEKEQEKKTQNKDPLPSWNNGENKKRITSFVENAVNENSESFIPVEHRIATFDNDGTLWAENPVYFQLIFAFDRIKEMAKDHPEWENEKPYKFVLSNEYDSLLAGSKEDLIKILMTTHSGMTVEDFQGHVKDWIYSAKHPKFNVEYSKMIYKPTLELIDYLKANDFKVYIVSGGGIDFMRAWTKDVYGIPNEQVIGTTLKSKLVETDSTSEIIKLAELDFLDDKEGKPVAIQKFIGKKPVIAVGNSDGDLQMLQFSAGNKMPSLQIYIHHTDAEREYQYDRDSHIGRLDKGLDEASKQGWVLVDMKKDWKKIFDFQ